MGFMHRVKVMLGLADDYDEYDDEYYDDEAAADDEAYGTPVGSTSYPASPYGQEPASVKRLMREPDLARAREAAPMRPAPAPAPVPQQQPAAAQAPQVRIHTVEPRSYSEAQSIADKFKAGQPVIMNLTMTDADLAKRLIDFASGLTYGLSGGLQRVSDKVFMLTPSNVDVSAADRARLRDTGFFAE